MTRVRRCTATMKNGEPCEAFASAYSDHLFCASHDPNRRYRDARTRIPYLEKRRVALADRIAKLETRLADLDDQIARNIKLVEEGQRDGRR